MHFPELTLGSSSLRRFCCDLSIGMGCRYREMTEDVKDLIFQMVSQFSDHKICLFTELALIIAIFNQRDRCIKMTESVVLFAYGLG